MSKKKELNHSRPINDLSSLYMYFSISTCTSNYIYSLYPCLYNIRKVWRD